MGFNTTVVIVAATILVAILVFTAYAIHRNKATLNYPPVTANCPDYWTSTSANVCVNTQNLGTCGDPKDFSAAIYQGDAGICERSKWAKNCGIVWDGITNNVDACHGETPLAP